MSSYDYQTGQVRLDFSFKKIEGSCKKDNERTRLIGVYCKSCEHYKGQRDNYVFCSFHSKDDEGASGLRKRMSDYLRNEAYKALYNL